MSMSVLSVLVEVKSRNAVSCQMKGTRFPGHVEF